MQAAVRKQKISRASLSISLSPEMAELRKDLAKVVVLSLEERFVNESNLLVFIPSIINRPHVGQITPLNECTFWILLASREEVKDVCKMGSFKAVTKDGPCTLKLSPWSADLGTDERASGVGQWI